MKKNMISLYALLLVGAASMMTAGAQTKPTLAVFVVGGDNSLINPLAVQLGINLTSGGRYEFTSVSTADKLAELQATYITGGGSSINRDALATWGRTNNISAICLVVDDIKGNDHLFSAQLIDAKNSKLESRGNYTRTDVTNTDVTRVALALSKQLEGQGRMARKSATPQKKWFEPEMVFVEGATSVTLGWRSTDGSSSTNGVKAAYTATVGSFKIGKYEVTQAQWKAVMAGTGFENFFYWGNVGNCGSVTCDDQRPVENISWYLMVAFCNKLSGLADLTAAYNGVDLANIGTDGNCAACNTVTVNADATGYRLPTSEEWEYAARGCKAGNCENFMYSGNNDMGEVAWNNMSESLGYANGATHPVGQLKPNGLGIYDMSGNVWEVCGDTWDASFSNYIRRGGCWPDDANSGWLRVAARAAIAPSAHDHYVGFRVALPAQ